MVKKNKLPRSKLARYSGTSPEKFVSLLPSSVQQAVRFSASRNKQQTSWYHWVWKRSSPSSRSHKSPRSGIPCFDRKTNCIHGKRGAVDS